eukprot:m.41501 g.41501  ORF g.41501 m.41501 type:complete len:163 (+) comp33193_c0_seq1:1168-1656(+)
MITNFHYRNMGDIKWNQTTITNMDVLSDDLVQGRRRKRSIWSKAGHWFSHIGHKIADGFQSLGHKIVNTFKKVKDGISEALAKKTWTDLKLAAKAIYNEAKKVIAKCHVLGFLEKGAECIGSAIGCGTGIAGEVPSDGADTFETVATCAKTVDKCVHFGQCF